MQNRLSYSSQTPIFPIFDLFFKKICWQNRRTPKCILKGWFVKGKTMLVQRQSCKPNRSTPNSCQVHGPLQRRLQLLVQVREAIRITLWPHPTNSVLPSQLGRKGINNTGRVVVNTLIKRLSNGTGSRQITSTLVKTLVSSLAIKAHRCPCSYRASGSLFNLSLHDYLAQAIKIP